MIRFMIFSLPRISIRIKLVLIQLVTAFLVTFISANVFLWNEINEIKDYKVTNLKFISHLIASSTIPYILANDTSIENLLLETKYFPDISNVLVRDNLGKTIASYNRQEYKNFTFKNTPNSDSSYFLGMDDLYLFTPIVYNNDVIGMVCLRSKPTLLKKLAQRLFSLGFGAFVFSFSVALVISILLQKSISSPILKLKNIMENVSRNSNYSLRSDENREDEIGILAKEFNYMLNQIQQRDFSLQNATEKLEEMVKKRTKELSDINIKLYQSNKELEQFAYVASHDLQEPLRAIKSYIQLIQKRYKNDFNPEANEFMQYVISGADRMHILINDLLLYSRVGTRVNHLTDIDIDKIIKIVMENIADRVNSSKAKIIIDNHLPVIKADSIQMIQLFQNLITNAIKYQPKNQIPEIHIGLNIQNEFYIKDNGIGIKNEYFDKIFVIFQRLHSREEYTGTGIGLAVCKKIVERYGGKIWVASDGENSGTTFWFTLPSEGKKD